jgi:enamine deaminase RidA (YjgF/YER057c/UK114 family)
MSPESPAGRRVESTSHLSTETSDTHGCPITLRCVEGPHATELFLHCQPPATVTDPSLQAQAVYRAIVNVLGAAGGSFGAVVCETVFLRDLQSDIASVRQARQRILASHAAATHRPATTQIEQPPLNERAALEVLVHAVVSNDAPLVFETVETTPVCGCAECVRTHGLRFTVDEEIRFHAGGLCGPGDTAYEQTLGMFAVAEKLLRRAGMELCDVVRTWIYLRDIDRDYADLNRARREFFEARDIDPVPASTGIGGGPVAAAHDLCLGVYAVKGGSPPVRTVMTSPTLNEASQYGADFVRGLRMVETNKVALHVSGTASIDEHGRTAHPDNFEAQADRMLVNIAALLEQQGASVSDVVCAITYLKNPADASRLREKFEEAGYVGFPNALVAAPICRPDLMCETEALAVLPTAAQLVSNGG